MNFRTSLSKAAVIFFFVFCYVIGLHSVEADHSVRLITTKRSSPVYIHVAPGGLSHPTYAKKFSYGRPVINFNTLGYHSPHDRNKKYFGRRQGNPGAKNYANRFKTWTTRSRPGPWKNNPRIDNGKRGLNKYRNDHNLVLREPPFVNNKQKRKTRPFRFSPMQRPHPPKLSNEFDEDYFFPEEAIEANFESDSSYTRFKKKRKHPSEVEKLPKRQLHQGSKISYYNEKPTNSHKNKLRGSPISYSQFVQHVSNDEDYYDEDSEPQQYLKQTIKNKKKRTKKKPNSSSKKTKEVENESNSYENESDDSDKYQAVYITDYEPPSTSTKKHNKKPSATYVTKDENSAHSPSRLNLGLSSSTEDEYGKVKINQKPQEIFHFAPTHSPTWPQTPVHALNTESASQRPVIGPFVPNAFHYQETVYSDHPKAQISQSSNRHTNYYSDNNYENIIFGSSYASNQVTESPIIKNGFNNYNSHPTNTYSTYEQYDTSQNDNTLYKPNFASNENELFYNGYRNTNNGLIRNPGISYIDNTRKYVNRYSNTYQPSDTKLEEESEFLRKHQNLYHKGLSGIPVQGDGYAKDHMKKEYDIGYGDFQFVENSSV